MDEIEDKPWTEDTRSNRILTLLANTLFESVDKDEADLTIQTMIATMKLGHEAETNPTLSVPDQVAKIIQEHRQGLMSLFQEIRAGRKSWTNFRRLCKFPYTSVDICKAELIDPS